MYNVYMLTCIPNGKRFFGKTQLTMEEIFGNLRNFNRIKDLANDIRFYD